VRTGAVFENHNPASPVRLWVVATVLSDFTVIAFPLSRFRNNGRDDLATVISAGEHPSIRFDSAVSFEGGKHIPADAITSMIQRGWYAEQEDLPAGLLERIWRGALESEFTPRGIKAAIREEYDG